MNAGCVAPDRATEVLALDEALDGLAAIDPRKSKLVELRYFGGLTFEQAAQVLNISTGTARRDWRGAKAWLYRALTESGAAHEG
ncbi:MAG TPA: ECF-type sigma factor [Pyrinomonadaceae bacterium]|nr:ECF-type sigma factor [Pyrinomonadaceae bacterium]